MCDGDQGQSTASTWQNHLGLEDQDRNPALRLMLNFTLNNLLMQLFIHTYRRHSTQFFFMKENKTWNLPHLTKAKCKIFFGFFFLNPVLGVDCCRWKTSLNTVVFLKLIFGSIGTEPVLLLFILFRCQAVQLCGCVESTTVGESQSLIIHWNWLWMFCHISGHHKIAIVTCLIQ